MGFLEKIFGTHSQNELKRIYPIADRIEAMDADMQKLTDEELRNKTKEFKEMLERRTGLSVILWDERLTTVSADNYMMESGIRREDRKKYVDEIAAIFILQGYLDYLSLHPEEK